MANRRCDCHGVCGELIHNVHWLADITKMQSLSTFRRRFKTVHGVFHSSDYNEQIINDGLSHCQAYSTNVTWDMEDIL